MTTANLVTISRIVLIPFLLVILLTEMQNKEIFAFLIFITAAITDTLDGYIARKYNQVTDLGKFLDPLADKLLVSATLIAMVNLELVETWVATVIILREISITGFRFYFLVNHSSFSSSWPAKFKTVFQIVALGILILCKKLPYAQLLFTIGTIILYFATFLTIYSGIEYIVKYSKTSKEQ